MEIALKIIGILLIGILGVEGAVNATFASIYMSRVSAGVIFSAAVVGLLILSSALVLFHRVWGEPSMQLGYPLSIMMGISAFLSILKEKALAGGRLKPKRRGKARGG